MKFCPVKKYLLTVIILAIFIAACATVPVTGRRQIKLLPSEMVLSMSFQSYQDFLSQNKLSGNLGQTQMVKKVGYRIQKAVEEYFAAHDLSNRLAGYSWEFNLVEDKAINAWAMPGGKVVIYTGILPVTQGDKGLAVVMGHEIAHAVARHGNERMSQVLLAQLGGIALEEAIEKKPQETRDLFMNAYGMGATLGLLLPFSRLHESEADRLGLIFMSMAGYDPHESVNFWTRMAEQKKGGQPPQFLSTHPSDERRIANLQQLLPEAMQYYRGPK
jgi:predicted Zn-dependent protease